MHIHIIKKTSKIQITFKDEYLTGYILYNILKQKKSIETHSVIEIMRFTHKNAANAFIECNFGSIRFGSGLVEFVSFSNEARVKLISSQILIFDVTATFSNGKT